MENMNAVDIGTWIAIIGFWFKTSQDKANDAKEFGQMKQQIDDLEKRASRVDDQLSKIDSKLSRLTALNVSGSTSGSQDGCAIGSAVSFGIPVKTSKP